MIQLTDCFKGQKCNTVVNTF